MDGMTALLILSAWLWLGIVVMSFVFCMGYRPTAYGWFVGIACFIVPVAEAVRNRKGCKR